MSIAEEQLAKVDAQYSSAEDTQLLRVGAVEERILSFERQLEERSRADLNMAVCFIHSVLHILSAFTALTMLCLQCFDTVGWTAGRASGL